MRVAHRPHGRVAWTATIIAALVGVCPGPAAGQESYVWWEGEKPADTNFPKRTWYSPNGKEAALLSGGDWLTNIDKRKAGQAEAFAVYDVNVPADGEYDFWTRKFWKHGPFRWRFDDRPWRTCGRDCALADNVTLRTHVGANWVHLGKVRLAKGKRRFELRLLAKEGEAMTACFDAFVLSRGAFVPNGKLKPGERSGQADEGFFAYEPPPDAFAPDAALDMRALNEKLAGQSGFVKRKGDKLVLGDGKEVRFWAVNVSSSNAAQDRASVDYLARRLAKLGVNMVRYHSPLFDRGRDVTKLDSKKLDDLHYLVAAMKKQGIYTTISFYFPLWFGVLPEYGIPGYDKAGNQKPFALLFFQPRMQEIHRAWARQLLTTKNPYTGVALAKEPAVAIVEIINEDSFFFWTFARKNVPDVHWRALEKLFGAWLTKRYGGIDKAVAAWGGARQKDDDAAGGAAGLYDAWHMTRGGLAQGGDGQRKRVGDQVRFLTELQRGYYASTVKYIKGDLGYGGLVSCSNWHTADPATLDALERYTYMAGDVIDRHGYFGGMHKGEGASYSVRVGHTYRDRSALREPWAMPLTFNQVAGYPHIISEVNWPNPNRYRAEMTLLAAAYGGLQGADGIYFFAVGSNAMRDLSMSKFAVASPAVAATLPGCALIYRRGDVTEPAPAVSRKLKLANLYAMKGERFVQAQALDELRKAGTPEARAEAVTAESLAYFVGPVVRSFDPKAAEKTELRQFIDSAKSLVRSSTGQVQLDYGRGVLTVNTRRSRAAAGFLGKAGAIKLGDVMIECGNEYAAIVVTALDDKPVGQSHRILIQVMTEERPFGFRAGGGKITDLGGAPFGVRKIKAKVVLGSAAPASPYVAKAIALDENGYPRGKPRQLSGADALTVDVGEDAIYTIIERW